MESDLEQILGGSLRPSDPRRYLIEAMVAAMTADGSVDPRELEVLHRHLAGHELFARLPSEVARMLIDLATDAVRMAADRRVSAIARGLPTRTHRLAAYAMACEVCAADQHIHDAEVSYLEALALALRLSGHEAGDLFDSAGRYRPMDMLADKIARLGRLTARVVDCFALQHCMERRLLKRHRRRLHEVLVSLVDIHASPELIESELDRALDPIEHSQNVPRALERLATAVSDPADRYWFAVYLAAGYHNRGREFAGTPFWQLLRATFELNDSDDAIAEHASLLVTVPVRALARPPGRSSPMID
jgi:uncharacterized tellurite resistance protein B-like protein